MESDGVRWSQMESGKMELFEIEKWLLVKITKSRDQFQSFTRFYQGIAEGQEDI